MNQFVKREAGEIKRFVNFEYAKMRPGVDTIRLYDAALDREMTFTLREMVERAILDFEPKSYRKLALEGVIQPTVAKELIARAPELFLRRDKFDFDEVATRESLMKLAEAAGWIPFDVFILKPWQCFSYQVVHLGKEEGTIWQTVTYEECHGGDGTKLFESFPESVDLEDKSRPSIITVVLPPRPEMPRTVDPSFFGEIFATKYAALQGQKADAALLMYSRCFERGGEMTITQGTPRY